MAGAEVADVDYAGEVEEAEVHGRGEVYLLHGLLGDLEEPLGVGEEELAQVGQGLIEHREVHADGFVTACGAHHLGVVCLVQEFLELRYVLGSLLFLPHGRIRH